jgi:hypothetical protein
MAKTCPRSTAKIASLQQICQEQLHTAHNVVLLCGAGVTMSEYGGAASWAALLQDGVQYASDNGADANAIAAMQAILARADATPEEWLRVGHDLTVALKALNHWELWLRDAVEDSFTQFGGPLLTALAQCGQLERVRFATTNYDFLLERAMGWRQGQAGLPGFSWHDKNKAIEWQRGKLREVYHLHGHVRAKQSIVLGTASYDALNADQWIDQLRKAMALTDTVIFVGCGATLQDPAFRQILETGFQQVQAENSDRRWYQLVSNDECVGNPWITALPYGADYTALPAFIQNTLLPWLQMQSAVLPVAVPPAAEPDGNHSGADPGIDISADVANAAANIADAPPDAITRLTEDFAAAVHEDPARTFRLALCQELRLPASSDAAQILRKLDVLPNPASPLLQVQLLTIQKALRAQRFAPASMPHPIERAANALYLRAAIRFVNLQAAAVLRTSVGGLTVVPEKSEVVIAILMAALEGEIHPLVLKDGPAQSGVRSAGAINMIDADNLAHDPLQDDMALELEVRKRVNKSFRPEQVDGKQMTPQQREDFRAQTRADVLQQQYVDDNHFRIIVSHHKAGWVRDDALCGELWRKLGIPLTRVGMDQAMAVESLIGLDRASIDAYFRQFLELLDQARQGASVTTPPVNN